MDSAMDSVSPPPPPARDEPRRTRGTRRREQTREQLMAGARQLISAHGVERLRLRDLAETADVGIGTLYNHFATLDELVAAIAAESLNSLAASLIPALPDDTDPALIAGLSAIRSVRLAYDDPELARLIVNLDHADGLFCRTMVPHVRVVLERGITAGRFVVTDPDTASIMLAGGGLALIRAILTEEAPPDADHAHARSVLHFLGVPGEQVPGLIALCRAAESGTV